MGDASWYRPAEITFNDLTGGSLVGTFVPSAPGSQGLPLDDAGQQINNTFTEGYWSLTRKNALSSNDYDLALTANGFSTYPVVDETQDTDTTGCLR